MKLEEKSMVAWILLHPVKQIVDIEGQTADEFWHAELPRPMCRIKFQDLNQRLTFLSRFICECVGEDKQYVQAEIRGLPALPGFDNLHWRAPHGEQLLGWVEAEQ